MSDYKRVTNKDDFVEYCGTADCPQKYIEKLSCGVEDCDNCYFNLIYNRLSELEDKLERGQLVEVPCNEGDKIYFDCGLWADHCKGEIMERYADIVRTDVCTTHRGEIDMTFDFNDFGKKVFLSKEQAKSKLKELQEGKR